MTSDWERLAGYGPEPSDGFWLDAAAAALGLWPEKDASVLSNLQEAKRRSDRKDYRAKHAILRRVLENRPHEFLVDSLQGNIVGLTHRPTRFRIHTLRTYVPRAVMETHREKSALTASELAAAASDVDTEPTQAQIEAGNYRKGHARLHGFGITIENPKGSVRRGVSETGKAWETKMRAHYGYIKRTVSAADGDHVDVFIGPDLKSEMVFVVDQVDPETGKFDEHKVMLCYPDLPSAAAGYLENYEDGWRGMGAIHATDVAGFKRWLAVGDTGGSFRKAAALLPNVELQRHQREVADTGKDDEARVLVYHALGSGKTLSSLAAAEAAGKPYVAVTPASLRPNYDKEVAKFTDRSLPHKLVSYNAVARGTVPAADTLVADEAHRLRNPNSLTSRNFAALARKAKHLYLLSGSPVVNHPHDLAPLVSMLSGREMSPEDFDNTFLDERKISPGFFGWLKGVAPAYEPTMANRGYFERLLGGHVHHYAPAKPDVDTKDEHYTVEMSPEQADLYRGFWNQLPVLTRWKLQSNFPLTSQEMVRLSAFLSGPRQVSLSTYPFMRSNAGSRTADALAAYHQSPKLRLAVAKMTEALAKNPDWKGVAYSNFIDAGLTPYAAALEARKVPFGVFHGGLNDAQRKQVVEDYNAGRTRALLLGPSGGEGISLKGTRLIQVLDPHWNSARTNQAIGRGLRFDSHVDLDPDQRNMVIQRFVSHLPKTFWQRVWRHFVGGAADPRKASPGADTFLEQLNARKDKLNDQFLGELRRIGTHKAAVDARRVLTHARRLVKSADDAEARKDGPGLLISLTQLRVFDRSLDDAERLLDGTPDGFHAALESVLPGRDDGADYGPVVAVDLDGTLAEEDGDFDPEKIGDPREGARAWMEKLQDAGAYLTIWTCRGNEGLIARWLDAHNIPWDAINEAPWRPPGGSEKIYADVYVDNKGVDASGPWDEFGPTVLGRVAGRGRGD